MNNSPRKDISLFQKAIGSIGGVFAKMGGYEMKAKGEEEGTDAGSVQDGYSYADKNTDWRTVDRKETIQNMLLDEKINQVLSAYKKPLSAAQFFIQPATDEKGESSPEDIANALTLEKNLFDEMDRSWRAFVKDSITSLEWGHAVFEKIYGFDGHWKVKKLAFRPQKTIEKWTMQNGEAGVMQQIDLPEKGGKSIFNIPEEKLLIFTNDKIGSNYEGTSILRPVYRAWKIKDMVWKYHVRILEKFSGGILQVWVPDNTQQDALDKLQDIIADITASKQSGIVHPGTKEKGWNAEFMDLKIGDTKILETMQKLDNAMSESLLNSFLDSTNGQAGSYARSESLKDFFNQALNGWLEYFCEEFNGNVIKQIGYLNGWTNCPKLSYHPIKNAIEIDKFANAVSTLANAKGLTLGEDDEDAIRDMMGMPERVYKEGADDGGDNGEDDMADDKKTPPEGEKKPEDEVPDVIKMQKGCECGHTHDGPCKSFQKKLIDAQMAKHFTMPDFRSLVANKKAFVGGREMTQYEKKANLGGLDDYTQQVRKFLDEKMTDITERQKAYMLGIIKEAVSKNDIAILENANIPHENELIELLTEITKESFEAGKITASQELGSEVPKTSKDVRGVIRAEQVAIVGGFLAGMKLNAVNSVVQVLKRKGNDITETSTSEALNNAKIGMDGYITKQKSGYNTSAVMGSINAGRSSVYEENADEVLYAQYSAILDDSTTARCSELDGKIVRYGSPEYYAYSPPGHYNCRSVWVGIMKDEVGSEKINLKHIPASIPPTGPLGSFRDLNQE